MKMKHSGQCESKFAKLTVRVFASKSSEVEQFCYREWNRIDRRIKGTPYIQDRSYSIVARFEGAIVGCLLCHTVVGVMVLDQVIVADSQRRLGVATALIDAVEALAVRLYCHKIYLETCPRLTKVHLIHRARGYSVEGKLRRHHGGWDFIQMVKMLPNGRWFNHPRLEHKRKTTKIKASR